MSKHVREYGDVDPTRNFLTTGPAAATTTDNPDHVSDPLQQLKAQARAYVPQTAKTARTTRYKCWLSIIGWGVNWLMSGLG